MTRMLVVALLALLASGIGSRVNADPLDPITINADVRNESGDPLEGIPLVLVSSAGDVAGAVTNAQGRAVLAGSIPSGDRVVCVRVSGGGDDEFPQEQRAALLQRMRSLFREKCIRQDWTLSRDPAQAGYTLSITANPCVAVSGRTGTEEALVSGTVATSGVVSIEIQHQQPGWFRTRVERSRDTIVFISAQRRIIPVPILGTQLESDLDLGLVAYTPSSEAGDLSCAFIGSADFFRRTSLLQAPGITFVGTNGQVYTASAKIVPGEQPREYLQQPFSLTIPPGEYYVAPASFTATAAQIALIDAVRRGDDLTNSGVPKVTTIAGQTVNIEVDLAAAYAACHNLRRP
ncbi:MAG TPA: hypothetical protein VG797_00890 [Phycisphaerales bacterium]|nr:hypothetical protein [Phycisphaerales bacterium]